MNLDAPAGTEPAPLEPPAARPGPRRLDRATALVEVVLCSGFPTQLALGTAMAAAGHGPVAGRMSLNYVVILSLLDTTALVALILFFLRTGGERPRDLFLGRRPSWHEAVVGMVLAFVALGLALMTQWTIQEVAPWLRTFDRNPFQDLVRTPRDVALFAFVVVVAGGVREEIQRAFLLSRFERSLGGATVGIVVASAAFGLGHVVQGADAAIATALLGAFWGIVYLRRRSIVAPVVSHSGFNLAQLGQFFVGR
jgi:membrane protease YdiL (CAAX protease family)